VPSIVKKKESFFYYNCLAVDTEMLYLKFFAEHLKGEFRGRAGSILSMSSSQEKRCKKKKERKKKHISKLSWRN